eukprot:TRINITY_DN30342_c0_g1_i1.p2 TRINITY_DN30342_c0_g1~~TRINITY_DN30342_c0_g1_i1.p2  ORF type:complete len:117 (+),score=27.52 TRINITY_DN30342_c0_g1_i1:75-425(+)
MVAAWAAVPYGEAVYGLEAPGKGHESAMSLELLQASCRLNLDFGLPPAKRPRYDGVLDGDVVFAVAATPIGFRKESPDSWEGELAAGGPLAIEGLPEGSESCEDQDVVMAVESSEL